MKRLNFHWISVWHATCKWKECISIKSDCHGRIKIKRRCSLNRKNTKGLKLCIIIRMQTQSEVQSPNLLSIPHLEMGKHSITSETESKDYILSWCWWNFLASANQIAQIGSCDRSRIQVPDLGGTGVCPGKNSFHKKCKTWIILQYIWLYLQNQSEKINI